MTEGRRNALRIGCDSYVSGSASRDQTKKKDRNLVDIRGYSSGVKCGFGRPPSWRVERKYAVYQARNVFLLLMMWRGLVRGYVLKKYQ